MKNQVLLISPKINSEYTKNYRPETTENLGLAYLAGYLEHNGIRTDVLDFNSNCADSNALTSVVEKGKYILAGISANSSFYLSQSLKLADLIRNIPNRPHIVLGGHSATARSEEIIQKRPQIESIVRGEGERTLYELFVALKTGTPMDSIKGLTFRSGSEVRINESRENIEDLDLLPFPKHYNLERILRVGDPAHIITSRGCPGQCSFCVIPLSNRWRPRSAENVLAEITFLYEQGIRNFVFDDENYTGRSKKGRERAKTISRLILKEGLNIKYKVSLRVEDLEEDLLDSLISSGLSRINLGIESFNKRQLEFYNKGFTPEQAIEAIRRVSKRKISAALGFMMFDPYVSLDELQTNHDQIKRFSRLFPFKKVRTSLKPYKGSKIWKQLKEEGLLVEKSGYEDFYTFVNPDANQAFEIM